MYIERCLLVVTVSSVAVGAERSDKKMTVLVPAACHDRHFFAPSRSFCSGLSCRHGMPASPSSTHLATNRAGPPGPCSSSRLSMCLTINWNKIYRVALLPLSHRALPIQLLRLVIFPCSI
ncbi:hypothetical protein F5Y08DRAFT_312500 [Xylaria arbuscula]|nr:hypothetical protein F5Y08DRAFT_312500 [Xylaria arbuscula]